MPRKSKYGNMPQAPAYMAKVKGDAGTYKVWGIDFEGGDRAVDGRIKVLRAALGPAGKQIRTVFKVGYKLEGEQHGAD